MRDPEEKSDMCRDQRSWWLAEQGIWVPERSQIVIQFFTRYFFLFLGVMFFLTVEAFPHRWLDLNGMMAAFGVYFLLTSLLFVQALRRLTLWQLRFSMGVDALAVSLCVIHDPNLIPPSALAYLMVVFGNGMRYGMRMFAESLFVTLSTLMVSYVIRQHGGQLPLSGSDVFFGIFWVSLAFYAFMLMGTVDRQRKLLDQRSRYDALTGLLNRHGLMKCAGDLLTHKADRVTVFFSDLNNFKHINDLHGHAMGDRVLSEFAHILKQVSPGGVAGRWGGDEFVLLVRGLDAEGTQILREKLCMRLDNWAMSNDLKVGVSVGVAHAPEQGHDLLTLLGIADIELYQHKACMVGTRSSNVVNLHPHSES
jgi:diguanylate cyclase (GGDEF)-like protein